MKVDFYPISNTVVDLLVTGGSVKKNIANPTTNGAKDPQHETIWLKRKRKQSEQSVSSNTKMIIQYTYHSKAVFFSDECIKYPSYLLAVYSYGKGVFCEFGEIAGVRTYPDFEKNTIS
jgi:hypothetical protein